MPHPNYRLPEANIHFDARKDIAGWQSLDYEDQSWNYAVECGEYPCSPWIGYIYVLFQIGKFWYCSL